MNAKVAMFEKYPDVVEVDQLREMLGGISRKLAYKLLSEKEIHSVRIGRTYKIPKAKKDTRNLRKTERLYQSALVHRRRLLRCELPAARISSHACRH